MNEIKALVFDVGGTVLDWHTGVADALGEWGSEKGTEADWSAVADHWRNAALTRMLRENESLPRDANIDDVHRMTLDGTLEHFGITELDTADRDRLTAGWHRLPAWPDAKAAWPRLRESYTVSTLTILSVAMIVNASRHAGIGWDCVISCEFLGEYKPNPGVYAAAPRLLQLEPDEIMMVAAHNFDLLGARKQGLRSAFVRRTNEWGGEDLFDPGNEPDPGHDIFVDSFLDLADQVTALD